MENQNNNGNGKGRVFLLIGLLVVMMILYGVYFFRDFSSSEVEPEIIPKEQKRVVSLTNTQVIENFISKIQKDTKYFEIVDEETYAFMIYAGREFPGKDKIKTYLRTSEILENGDSSDQTIRFDRKTINEYYYLKPHGDEWVLDGWSPMLESKDTIDEDPEFVRDINDFVPTENEFSSIIGLLIDACLNLSSAAFSDEEDGLAHECPYFLYQYIESLYSSHPEDVNDFEMVIQWLLNVLNVSENEFDYKNFFDEETSVGLEKAPLKPTRGEFLGLIKSLVSIVRDKEESNKYSIITPFFPDDFEAYLIHEDENILLHLNAKKFIDLQMSVRDRNRLNDLKKLVAITKFFLEEGKNIPLTKDEFESMVSESEIIGKFPEDPLCEIYDPFCYQYSAKEGNEFLWSIKFEHSGNFSKMSEDKGSDDARFEYVSEGYFEEGVIE